MFESKEWHIDGTFKKCPKNFKQMLTLQVIIKGLHLNAAFIFCQNKSRDVNAFDGVKDISFRALGLILANSIANFARL